MAEVTINTVPAQQQVDALIRKLRETGKQAGLSEEEINDMSRALQDTGTKGTAAIDNVNKSMQQTSNIANDLGKGFLAMFAVDKIIAFGQELGRVAIKYESLRTAIDFAVGSQEQGAATMQFIANLADRLGLNLAASAEGFKQIAGASRNTVLEGQATRDIFEGISLAASKMKLSADNTTGALLAISQMISKGKVSAEELRGQLGERLPGAFQIFARSIGVSTQELDKMLEKGEVIATETLPKFAEQLKKEFGTGAAEAQGLGAAVERLSNNWEQFLFTVVSKDGGAIAKAINFIANEVKDLNEALAGEQGAIDRNIAKNYELLQKELVALSNPADIQSKIEQLQAQNELLKQTAEIQQKIVDDLAKKDLGKAASFGKAFLETGEDIFGRGVINSEDIFGKGLTEGEIMKLQEYKKLLEDSKSQLGTNSLAVKELEQKLAALNAERTKSNQLTEEQIKKLQREREEAEKLLETLRKRAAVELAGGADSVGGLEVLEQQQQQALAKQIEQTKKAKKVSQLSVIEINALTEQIQKEFDQKRFTVLDKNLEAEKKARTADILSLGLTQEQQNTALLTLENQHLQAKKSLYQQYSKDVSTILQSIQTNDLKTIESSVNAFEKSRQEKLRLIEEEARTLRQRNFDTGQAALAGASNQQERSDVTAANALTGTITEIDINKKKIQADIDYLEAKKKLYQDNNLDIAQIEKELSDAKDALQQQELNGFKATEEEKTRIAQMEAERRKALQSAAIDAGLQIVGASMQIARNMRQGELDDLQAEEERKLRLAGNNEAKKEAIRAEFEGKKRAKQRDAAVTDKVAAGFQVVLDTAASIVKTGAQLGYPAAIPFQVLAGAVGLAQLAVVASQPIPKFSTGVINFRGKKGDNNLALIADGESVITEKGTRNAPKYLDMINKGLLRDGQLQPLKQPADFGVRVGSSLDIDTLAAKVGERFEGSISKLPQTKNYITNKGFFSIVQSGQNETLYVNRLFGW
jgi:tape measure domain-containing protein